jgi:uncharacterized OB-fold protein
MRKMADIPIPLPDGDSKPFWDAVAQEKLLIQRCDACQQFVFYPRSICPHCFSDMLSWVEARGTGTIYSFTVVHRAFGPFAGQTPFVVALVELAEGVRMMTRITGSEPGAGAVRIGAPVQVVFVEAGEGVTLPYFQLV